MRLIAQTGDQWQYLLHQNEARILADLIKKFPFTEAGPAQISRGEKNPQTAEREKLLTESLAEHRQQLKYLAVNLLAKDKWDVSDEGHLLTLNSESREILLQMLNDIRVGCWHALGEPETWEKPASAKELAHRNLMDLSGYFETRLIEPEE